MGHGCQRSSRGVDGCGRGRDEGRGGDPRVAASRLVFLSFGVLGPKVVALGSSGAGRARTGRLLAVAEGGVEDANVVWVVDLVGNVLRAGHADDVLVLRRAGRAKSRRVRPRAERGGWRSGRARRPPP